MRCGSVADFGSRGGRGKADYPFACAVCAMDTPTSRDHMPANEQCHGAMALGNALLGLSLAKPEVRRGMCETWLTLLLTQLTRRQYVCLRVSEEDWSHVRK